MDDDGTLYAADPAGNSLLEWTGAGVLKKRQTRDDTGRELSGPTGVAIDRKNRLLYVVNSGNNTVSKFKLPGRRTP